MSHPARSPYRDIYNLKVAHPATTHDTLLVNHFEGLLVGSHNMCKDNANTLNKKKFHILSFSSNQDLNFLSNL